MDKNGNQTDGLKFAIIFGLIFAFVTISIFLFDINRTYLTSQQSTAAVLATVRAVETQRNSMSAKATNEFSATQLSLASVEATAIEAELNQFAVIYTEVIAEFNEKLAALNAQQEILLHNPEMLNDSTWRLETSVAIFALQADARELTIPQELPKELEGYRAWMNRISPEIDLFTEAYLTGMDKYSILQMSTATNHIRNANAYIELASLELKTYLER